MSSACARYLPTYLSIYLPTYIPIYLPTYIPTYLSIYLSIYLPIYLSIYLPIYLPTYLPTYLSIYLYLSIYIYLSISIYLSIYLYNYYHRLILRILLTTDLSNISFSKKKNFVLKYILLIWLFTEHFNLNLLGVKFQIRKLQNQSCVLLYPHLSFLIKLHVFMNSQRRGFLDVPNMVRLGQDRLVINELIGYIY